VGPVDARGAAEVPAIDLTRERLASLYAVTTALSGALTPEEVADAVVGLGSSVLGGHSGSLCLVTPEGDAFDLVREIGYDPAVREEFARFPLDAPLPAGDAVRSGQPVFLESLADRDLKYPALAGRPARGQAFATLPLFLSDGTPLGAFTVGFEQPRVLDDEERAFLETLAGLTSQALERALAYERAERASERLAFLSEASAVVSASLDLGETLRQLAKLLVPRLCDSCAVVVVEADGRLAPLVIEDVDPERAVLLLSFAARFPDRNRTDVGLGGVLRTREPQWYERITPDVLAAAATNAPHLAALESLGFTSGALIPLVGLGGLQGVVSLATGQGRTMTADDFKLASDVVDRAAVAIDNARLYGEVSRIAVTLQRALLPPSLPCIPGVELAARYLPAGGPAAVGGDFYDAFPLDDGRWVLVIGDVCGRGVEAAAVTGVARHAIRSAAMVETSPGAILRALNRVLYQHSAEAPTAGAAEARFCTAAIAVLEVGTQRRVSVASAGHLPPLLRRCGAVTAVGRPGTLLGAFEDILLPDDTHVDLRSGDLLLLYTDGISEAHAGGRFFEERLLGIVASAGPSPAAVADALVDEVVAFRGGPLGDDVALLGVGLS
jgi:GAF domain-containing protein